MSLGNDLEALASPGNSGSDHKRIGTPEGWRPRMEIGSDGGFIISHAHAANEVPDAADLLVEFDLDPTQWIVTGVRKSRWQRYDGEFLEAARLTIAPAKQVSSELATDVEELIKAVAKWRPTSRQKPTTGSLAALFCVGDTQYGKDAGDGTAGTIARMDRALIESLARHKELLKTGRDIGQIVLPAMGDCIEGTASQHGKVIGRSDLSVTQQVRIGRRVMMNWIKAFAPLAESVLIPVVPGNHDEPHRIVITDPVDSWQIEIASAVQDACAENPALAHIEFRYPSRDDSTLAINIAGTHVGFAHGHQARDMGIWWQGQATGKTPVGAADVLITAHLHHFIARQVGPRLHVQIPAMDGGSAWFRNSKGLDSPTGIVSLVIGDGYDPRRDLTVLAGEQR